MTVFFACLGNDHTTTGTSSGIGRTAAVYLARKGFLVLAGVRKEADAKALRGECVRVHATIEGSICC